MDPGGASPLGQNLIINIGTLYQCFFYFFASVKFCRFRIRFSCFRIRSFFYFLVPKSSFRIRFSCFFSILARRRRTNCSFFTQKRKILSKCNDFSENPTFFLFAPSVNFSPSVNFFKNYTKCKKHCILPPFVIVWTADVWISIFGNKIGIFSIQKVIFVFKLYGAEMMFRVHLG